MDLMNMDTGFIFWLIFTYISILSVTKEKSQCSGGIKAFSINYDMEIAGKKWQRQKQQQDSKTEEPEDAQSNLSQAT